MTLAKKFGAVTLVLYAVLMVIFTAVYSITTSSTLKQNIADYSGNLQQGILRILRLSDTLLTKQVQLSMQLLQQDARLVGEPRLGESVPLGNGAVPQLYLGDLPQVQHYEFVDYVAQQTGGGATLFVLHGNDFVSIASNVMLPSGQRAVGTMLDANGTAHKMVRNGQEFYGMANILGSAYLTGYAPIKNKKNEVIGAYYAGYAADAKLLQEAIEPQRILKTGFLALLDGDGNVLQHSKHQNKELIAEVVRNQNPDWTFHTAQYPDWNYQVVVGYLNEELNDSILSDILTMILWVSLSAALLLAVLLGLLQRIVSRPLADMVSKLGDIAQGKLSVRLNTQSQDELGSMAISFNSMLAQFQETLSGIRGVADQLAANSEQLSAMASISSEAIAMQTVETDQIATAMNEMSSTVNEVAHSTENAASSAREAQRYASEGGVVVEETITSIEQLARDVEQAVDVINELSEASANISQVLDVIGNIAEQTNLLALNAAIEAARAGEHGRGFAVVADEVRSLASRTQQSTAEIKQMIDRIQQESQRAVDVMHHGEESAQGAVALTRESRQSLRTILSSVERINDLNTEIASAAEEQSAVAEEISRNVVRIRDAAENNNVSASESQQASNNLAHLAQELLERIRFFQ